MANFAPPDMTTPLNIPIPQETNPETPEKRPRYAKQNLDLSWREVMVPLLFMFSLSLIGLQVYPAIVVAVLFLINRFIKDRYDFLIMLGVMTTSGHAFLAMDVIPFQMGDVVLAASVVAMFFVRKNYLVKRVSILTLGFFLFMMAVALLTSERLWVQLMMMRYYVAVIAYFLVLWIFANREFDIRYFFRRLLIYFLIIAAFYAFDAIILSGWFFIPNDTGAWFRSTITRFTGYPFSFMIPRKWPAAFPIIICVSFALARYYKMNWWQWTIAVLGLGVTRTMTFIAPFFLTIIIFQGSFKKFAKYFVLATFALVIVYFVDVSTGSHLRIASTFEQFVDLSSAKDEEDVAQFGTTRMAQVIPKYQMLVANNALFTGLGFIHPELTTDPRYQIHNELYENVAIRDESIASMTEVTQFNAIIHMGILGLIIQAVYYLAVYRILKRRGRDADFYLSTIFSTSVIGLGGLAGLNHPSGLFWVGTAIGIALLDSRPWVLRREEEEQQSQTDAEDASEAKDAVAQTSTLPDTVR